MIEMLDIVTEPKEVKLWINGKVFNVKDGILSVSKFEIFALEKGERGLSEFDRQLSIMISEEQKIDFYELFLESTRVGLNEVMGTLGIERAIVREILILALKHKVLRKVDTQWRMEMHIKEKVQLLLKVKMQAIETDKDEIEPFKASQLEPPTKKLSQVSTNKVKKIAKR